MMNTKFDRWERSVIEELVKDKLIDPKKIETLPRSKELSVAYRAAAQILLGRAIDKASKMQVELESANHSNVMKVGKLGNAAKDDMLVSGLLAYDAWLVDRTRYTAFLKNLIKYRSGRRREIPAMYESNTNKREFLELDGKLSESFPYRTVFQQLPAHMLTTLKAPVPIV